MNDIGSLIRDAVDKALPPLIREKMQHIQSALNSRIGYELNNDIKQSPGRKYLDELDDSESYHVSFNYDGGYEASIVINMSDKISEEARSYLSSAVYQAKEYVLG